MADGRDLDASGRRLHKRAKQDGSKGCSPLSTTVERTSVDKAMYVVMEEIYGSNGGNGSKELVAVWIQFLGMTPALT